MEGKERVLEPKAVDGYREMSSGCSRTDVLRNSQECGSINRAYASPDHSPVRNGTRAWNPPPALELMAAVSY